MRVHGISKAQTDRLVAALELCRHLQVPPANDRPVVQQGLLW